MVVIPFALAGLTFLIAVLSALERWAVPRNGPEPGIQWGVLAFWIVTASYCGLVLGLLYVLVRWLLA